MKLRQIFQAAATAVILAMGAPAAIAQGAAVSMGVQDHDSSTPLEITSESLSLDQEAGTATFTGNVIVKQGGITMTCGRMVVEYKPNEDTGRNEIDVIRMFDKVTFVSDQEAAEADNAVYTPSADTILMTGNVLVTQGTTALSSDRLTYNLDNGDGLMEGNVKTILQQSN